VLDGAPSLAHPGERLLEFEHLEDHVSVELSILAETAQGGVCIAEGEMLPEPVNGREIGPERDRQQESAESPFGPSAAVRFPSGSRSLCPISPSSTRFKNP